MGATVSPDEVHLPFPAASRAQVPIATRFRSTWLASSLLAIRERQRLDEYFALLPSEHHEVIRNSVAGSWLPVDVALAHYAACDRLNFSPMDLYAIGRDVNTQTNASVLKMLVKLATGAGVTPWTAFSQFNRLWDRVWVGGGVGVYKIGPKEARLEVVGWPLARSTYARHAMRGVTAGLLEMFCAKAYVKELPALCTPTTLGYRCAWA